MRLQAIDQQERRVFVMKAAKSDAEISKGTHKEMLNASNKHSNSLPIIQKFLNQNEEIKGTKS